MGASSGGGNSAVRPKKDDPAHVLILGSEHLRNTKRVLSMSSLVDISSDNLSWVAAWETLDPNYNRVLSINESLPIAICEASLKVIK